VRELRTLTAGEIIDQRPLSRFQILTILLCGIVLVLDGFNTQSIGFLAPAMAETLGIPVRNFGAIFGAGLFGLMIASMAMGSVADRWGRKWPVVISTLVFATFTLLTASAASFNQLLILRFLTGLGLGGAIPNVVALSCEYAPSCLTSVVVGVLMCGMPLGLAVGGLAGYMMIPAWGWRSVFYLGGLLPLAVAILLIRWLPESVRFLALRGSDPKKIARFMAQIAPDLESANVIFTVPQDCRKVGFPVRDLFTGGRATGTILLWVQFFMSLVTLYFIVNWLPELLKQAAMPVSAGVMVLSLFSIGSIFGSLAQGFLMNRFGSYLVLLVEFGGCTLLAGLLAFVATSFPQTMAVTFVLGGCVTGAQSGLNALAAGFYPTSMRSTGVGWALGIGRIGSIVGPVLGGVMLSMELSAQQILLAGAVPPLCAAAATILSNRFQDNSSAYRVGRDAGGDFVK